MDEKITAKGYYKTYFFINGIFLISHAVGRDNMRNTRKNTGIDKPRG
jgi:hypothetical protein